MAVDAAWAFARYEAVRAILPQAAFPAHTETVAHLSAVAGRFETVLLDAFGVLNIGETAIPGAVAFIASLRAGGTRVAVVSNSASVPSAASHAKFARMGFDFTPDEIVTSRDALKEALATLPSHRWGVMAAENSQIEELGVAAHPLDDDPAAYDTVEGIILLGSADWTDARQVLLVESLRRAPRPVFVGNPDLVAPRESGLSLEPGYYAHDLAARTGLAPRFYGKPFAGVFDLAQRRMGGFDPAQTLMVGDTLHTDVLGGAVFGTKTCLLGGYGLLKGKNVPGLIDRSGIRPDILALEL